jgi:hypothetical protein
LGVGWQLAFPQFGVPDRGSRSDALAVASAVPLDAQGAYHVVQALMDFTAWAVEAGSMRFIATAKATASRKRKSFRMGIRPE